MSSGNASRTGGVSGRMGASKSKQLEEANQSQKVASPAPDKRTAAEGQSKKPKNGPQSFALVKPGEKCEIMEAEPHVIERSEKTARQHSKKYLLDAKNYFKTLLMNALAFIVAQAVQGLAQSIINAVYPPTSTNGWEEVASNAIYTLITFALALTVGFLWNLGEKEAKKRWIVSCPESER